MQVYGRIEPMLAKPVDQIPPPPPGSYLYEIKADGYRCIARIDQAGVVRLFSRRGAHLEDAFPEVVATLWTYLPAGIVVDGELVRFSAGRFDFAGMQRRYTQRRRAAVLSETEPCHYVIFDLLEAPRYGDVRQLPLVRRRRLLEQLMRKVPAGTPLALVMQTTDRELAQEWCDTLTHTGCEGIVAKPANSPYVAGLAGWYKYKPRTTAHAIVAGVAGRLRHPHTLILGRYDTRGRLRVVGRTSRLTTTASTAVGALLTRAGPNHPWPQRLTLAWATGPTAYVRVQPRIVVEVSADNAVDEGRWRHTVRYLRPRLDLHPDQVPRLV